ncbi:hypothetical protein SAMN04490244_101446 [Tranquillimonas rosea]|uniref:DUF5333 domain-containing protein n=1 Tax=Tranquillimonas rosea TaxID=641238 RepID=A0A1H9Q2U1_9RHOB|nr:DUF5333 domain-containing protein [Tranquillimonas rosea]SER54771.1 hypothetical protein SAMN04490244_101446 [Tranquillimonas rosea]
MTRPIAALALVVGLSNPAIAQALPPLEEDPTVVSGFYAIGLADEVRKNCDDISPRWIRAVTFLNSLKNYAERKGYSSADIKALRNNDAAEDALRYRIRADLAARGATPDNPEGYCAVGRAEIAAETQAGRLLSAH